MTLLLQVRLLSIYWNYRWISRNYSHVCVGGGYAYFRTPYMYPLWRDLQRIGIDYETLYPEHIWDLGEKWYAFLPAYIKDGKTKIELIVSKPSIVQESFKSHFLTALASYVLKAPWYVFHWWPYVGGWEAVYKKR